MARADGENTVLCRSRECAPSRGARVWPTPWPRIGATRSVGGSRADRSKAGQRRLGRLAVERQVGVGQLEADRQLLDAVPWLGRQQPVHHRDHVVEQRALLALAGYRNPEVLQPLIEQLDMPHAAMRLQAQKKGELLFGKRLGVAVERQRHRESPEPVGFTRHQVGVRFRLHRHRHAVRHLERQQPDIGAPALVFRVGIGFRRADVCPEIMS